MLCAAQDEALRPFVTVLRTCDAPLVRELAVQCVVHAITAHPRGLGSGWRSVLEALQVLIHGSPFEFCGQHCAFGPLQAVSGTFHVRLTNKWWLCCCHALQPLHELHDPLLNL